MEIEDSHPRDQSPALDVAKLRQGIPAKQAQVLDLMAEGYSLEQIAEITGLPLGTVRSRYRLAKDKMRRKTRQNDAEQ
jgi:DNA-directed RNA polymerase specialized sigma24 family protein